MNTIHFQPLHYSDGIETSMSTLYLNEQYSLVRHEDEALVVELAADKVRGLDKRKVRVPLINIDQVVIFGEATVTASAMRMLLQRRIAIHYLTQHGRSEGAVVPDPSKNVALRLAQYRAWHDPQVRWRFARCFVQGKLRNARTILLRHERKRETGVAAAAAARIKEVLDSLARLHPPEVVAAEDRMHGLGPLFGCEGQGSGAYFDAFGALLAPPWTWNGRVRRPPRDPVNALLSFGYVVLTSHIVSLIKVVGLEPYLGLLHSPGFGKPALALDIIEEFRPVIVDSVVITLLNTNVLHARDFVDEGGGIRLTDAARKTFLEKLEERLATPIQHPYFNYKTTYRRCIELQIRLLGKALLGEIPAYPPFIVR